ncbi:hypothetical protein HZA97_03145 [Candidatus Woesearchaeota archaeon]|nr:hypothetical protein [Candidatus Woesearchaeota archaeon]
MNNFFLYLDTKLLDLNNKKETKETVMKNLEDEVESFFLQLDSRLYNPEYLQKVHQNVKTGLEEYAITVSKCFDEFPNYLMAGPNSIRGFFEGFVFGGVLPGALTYSVNPALIILFALTGFWTGIYRADTREEQSTKKFNDLKKQKIKMIEGFLNV